MRRPLALTLGEPAGIGPDLAIALWQRRIDLDLPPFYVIADREYLARRARHLRTEIALAPATPREAGATFPEALPVVDIGVAVTAAPGIPDASSAPAAIAAIRLGVRHVLDGAASALVTNPIAKNV